MHRAIGYLSKRFTQIRPGEGRKVFLTFSYFFLIITAYYVIKPVSRSLVLDDLGHRMVPYADLVCAILMGPVVTLFARLVDRMPKTQLVSVSFAAVGGMMLLFWRLLAWPHPWISGLFYIWVSIFSVLVVTMFWLVANDLYRPREAKRLFGFIGSGGILGGIAGSSIAAVGAQVVGTENLLLLSVGFLAASWVVVQQLWQYAPERAGTGTDPASLAAERHETFLTDMRGFARLLMQSRYLLLLVTIVALSKLISSLVYYQVNPYIEQTFPSVDAKTTFTGIFLGGINVLAFFVQFFCTSWLLRRWGLLWALLLLPLGLLVTSCGLLMVPVFWIAASAELFDKSMNYSLNNTGKEVLYLPIDRSVRYKVKPFIDMVMFRFGKGLAAILGIVLLDVLKMPVRYLGILMLPLLALWLFAAVRMNGEYTMRIRTLLQARANARRARRTSGAGGEEPDEEELATALGSLAISREAHPKLSLAAQLFDGTAGSPSPHARALLEGLTRYEALVTKASQFRVGTELEQLKRVSQDQGSPMAMRRLASRILGYQLNQEALDYLCGMLIVERETAAPEERALIAGVFLNRLAAELPLAADPTVQYALALDPEQRRQFGWWKRDLTVDDLAYASPYNTYHHLGLPPGPICNPGLASIEAVLHPQASDYLFFVARPDGTHAFAATFEEHQRNIARYQR